METADSLAWMEKLDQRVTGWAKEQDRIARKSLRKLSSIVRNRVAQFVSAPIILEIELKSAGLFTLWRRNAHEITLNNDVIVSAKNLDNGSLIHWFHADQKGERLAFFFSKGSDRGSMVILDTQSGKVLERVTGSINSVIFDDESFTYSAIISEDKSGHKISPSSRVLRNGEVVFGDNLSDNQMVRLQESSDGRTAIADISKGWTSSEIYVGMVKEPGRWKRALVSKYPVDPIDFADDVLYSLVSRGMGEILRNKTRIIVGKARRLKKAVRIGSRLVCVSTENCSDSVSVFSLDGEELEHYKPSQTTPISIPLVTSSGSSAVFKAESFGLPYLLFEYSNSGRFRTLDELSLAKLDIEEKYTQSKDGSSVHRFEFGRKSEVVVAYGYGGFDISLLPFYSPLLLSLAEFGCRIAVTNLRGGSEFGEDWHRAGMRARKQKVFDDFISVLESLKEEGSRVVALGRSNGGLLVGAVMTQRPDLLSAAVIGYPVLDMLRFHRLYIGKLWTTEYGDPDVPSHRKYLCKYSPYHNLSRKRGIYPPTLVYTGFGDDRVHPAHAFKFVRKMLNGKNNVLLRVEHKGGHLGSASESLTAEIADIVAFIVKELNLKEVENRAREDQRTGARVSRTA